MAQIILRFIIHNIITPY